MTSSTKFIQATSDAQFIVQCRLKKANASSLNTVRAQKNTVVATITTVFRAPHILGNLKGKQITILLTQGDIKGSNQIIIAANPWQYGANVAIIETGRLTAKISIDDFHEQLGRSFLSHLDDKLQERIASSVLVVSGMIMEVGESDKSDTRILASIGKGWSVATVKVSRVLKGGLQNKPEINILFPGYGSEKWYAAPKFFVGQQGIWLLHLPPAKFKIPADKKKRPQYLVALDPMDFHLPNQIERISAVINLNK